MGIYPEETQVPSTTELSTGLQINPATVLKGMNQLVADGTIQIIYDETLDTIIARLNTIVQDTAAALRAGNFEMKKVQLWK